MSVEPRTEYLRNALEARRAKEVTTTPTPASIESKSRRTATTNGSSDPWLDQAHSEEDLKQATPIRRTRRPSEGALPRLRTQRELESETANYKNIVFDLNLKLELLKKQNNELKDQLDEARNRIEELEPFEDENIDLREDNDRLRFKVQDLEEDYIRLQDNNAEILQIQDETVANMEQQNASLEEAADMIFSLEKEKASFTVEIAKLKEQLAVSQRTQNGTQGYVEVDGNSKERYPTRVYSIDESRPSTSHFDSDYYSQPASPQVKVKVSGDSLAPVAYSEAAKNFLEMNKEGQRSVQDLKKRVSDASMKNAKKKSSKGSIPEVPQIPDMYQDSHFPRAIKRTPKKIRPMTPQAAPLHTTQVSPAEARSLPLTPTGNINNGLRGLFHDIRPSVCNPPSARSSRPSSSYAKSPLTPKGSHLSELQFPPRQSSRHAHTTSSSEALQSPARPDSKLDPPKQGSKSDLKSETGTETSEWAEVPPPPSVISEDLTTEIDRSQDRDRWWKSVDRLHNARQRDVTGLGRSSRSTPLASPYTEKDLFFNGAEDEEQFMRRARGAMGGRR